MEYYKSLDNLNALKNKILSTKVSDQDILDFIADINSHSSLELVENNLLVFEIYFLLKRIGNFIPLIDISLDTIPAKIIFTNVTSCSTAAPQETIKCNVCEPDKIPAKNNQEPSMDEIKKLILQKWSPFTKQDNPYLLYPEPGQVGDMQFIADDIVEGRRYQCDVNIDSEGNIVGFNKMPFALVTCDNYEEIYAGLLGQLLEYQK